LGDHEGVIRDTQRNSEAFDFVEEFAESPEVAWSLQQFRPQLLMMQVRARATQALESGKHEEAIQFIRSGIDELRSFYQHHSRTDLLEQSGEIQALESWLGDVESRRPLTPRERLEIALNEAVKQEDYEKAAQVRDALRNLGASG
jgi:excinuclease UvrABC helicase subunit UvrB